MAGKRHDEGRVCLCDRPDGSCAGLAVRRLSSDRVQELAEEIWTASSGDLLPARPRSDPRSSRAGASAQAAYVRRRAQERERWRPALVWLVLTWGLIGAAPAAGLLLSVTVGAWLGWPAALLLAAWTGWRLRFRPSAEVGIWRRQAAMQRRTAGMLGPLEAEGYLVLHDVTLPGWLDSLEHLVVGPTGVWVIGSWQHRRLLPGGAAPPQTVRGLRGQAFAVAETLAGWASVPVRPLLCVHGPWPVRPRPTDGVRVAGPAQLLDVVRDRPRSRPTDLGQITNRLLDVLRPAA
jgi:hypothetical protein